MKLYSALNVWIGTLHRRLATMFAGGTPASRPPLSTEQRAKDLIRAVDAGGLPLNPAIVNGIARQLGLEVSTHAPMAQTIERIRKAVQSL